MRLSVNDANAVEILWSDDLVFVGTDGKTSTKAERLAGMRIAAPSTAGVIAASNDQVKVRLYGGTAIITLLSTWNVRADNATLNTRYITTHVWAKQRGRWLLV